MGTRAGGQRMSRNGKAPAAATAQGLREDDPATSEIGPENTQSPAANQAQLISTIKAHIARGDKAAEKAEQHYIAAGQHLATLKADHAGTWEEWETLLKSKVGIGKSRASELMAIADGRKTVEGLRAKKAESVRQVRAQVSPLRSGETSEPGNGTKPPKPKSTSQDQRELEAAQAYAAELEAAREHDGHLAEELQAGKIRMAGLESEIEELRSAAPADGGNLVDQALKLVSRMSEAERKQFRDRLQQDFPPRRGRPAKQPQAETEPLITVAHDSVDGASNEKMKTAIAALDATETTVEAASAEVTPQTMAALDAGADCGRMPDGLRRAP